MTLRDANPATPTANRAPTRRAGESATLAPGPLGAGEYLTSRIVMVDDDVDMLGYVSLQLEKAGYADVIVTDDAPGALALIDQAQPDLVLLDVEMPGMSGIEILAQLRRQPQFEHLPVIVLTGLSDAGVKLEVLKLGATDVLAKPVDASELLLRVGNTLAARARHLKLAFSDESSGLANRARLLQDADLLTRRARDTAAGITVFTVSVPHLERTAQMLGAADASRLAGIFVERLEHALCDAKASAQPAGDYCLYRVSGEDFVAVWTAALDVVESAGIAERLVQGLRHPIVIGDSEIILSSRVGIAADPDAGVSVPELVERSALAAAHAVDAESGFVRYSTRMHKNMRHKLSLQHDLRVAVDNGDLELWYQPKVAALEGGISNFEALARWQHPDRGMIPPSVFIPMVEEMGMISIVGKWVLETACRDCAAWNVPLASPVGVAVNVSANQIQPALLSRATYSAIVESGLMPGLLTLELTESVFLEQADLAVSVLESVRGLGVLLSLDDFGTGFSSFSYLTRMPVDELKIDRSFVQSMSSGRRGIAIVRGIVAMAHELGLKVVAEGVESDAERAILRDAGCDMLQGFLLSKPLRLDAVHRSLAPLDARIAG